MDDERNEDSRDTERRSHRKKEKKVYLLKTLSTVTLSLVFRGRIQEVVIAHEIERSMGATRQRKPTILSIKVCLFYKSGL